MNDPVLKSQKSYWWIPLLSGIALLVFGVWSLSAPLESFKSLTIVFGLLILLSGVFEVYMALKNRTVVFDYLAYLSGGVLNIVLGLLLIANPETLLWLINLIIGFWLIYKGGVQINKAFSLKKQHSSRWKNVLLWGIALLILAAVLLWHPEIIGITIAFWISIAFIVVGVVRIYLALKMRELR